MLCSKCSELLKPIVAIDIDGTMGDYHGHFLGFAAMWLGKPVVLKSEFTYRGEGSFGEWFCRVWGTDMTTFREIKLSYRQGAQKRCMPLHGNMDQMVRAIKEVYDAEIWMTTTRPYLSLAGIDADTRFWLSKHEIPYDYLMYDEDKYEKLAERVDVDRVVFILDDEVQNLSRALQIYRSDAPTLYRTQYNAATLWRGTVADGAISATALVAKAIKQWRMENG